MRIRFDDKHIGDDDKDKFLFDVSNLAEGWGIPSITVEADAAPDEEWDDDTDPCIILPGQVVELSNSIVYRVFSVDATGRIILDQADEDTFLG